MEWRGEIINRIEKEQKNARKKKYMKYKSKYINRKHAIVTRKCLVKISVY